MAQDLSSLEPPNTRLYREICESGQHLGQWVLIHEGQATFFPSEEAGIAHLATLTHNDPVFFDRVFPPKPEDVTNAGWWYSNKLS